MAGKSKIEWCDATWNPVVGCSHISPGCDHCYAERMAHRLGKNPATPQYAGLTGPDGCWNGFTKTGDFTLPFKWRKSKRIFLCSMGDLFHKTVQDKTLDRIFAVMALAKHHTFYVLTKRVKRMFRYLADATPTSLITGSVGLPCDPAPLPSFPLPNVVLMGTIENQEMANSKMPWLMTMASLGWTTGVSVEPMLGPVDLRLEDCLAADDHALTRERLAWVVAGGETGPDARPAHPDWFRNLRDQCADAGTPFFFKGWGAWAFGGAESTHALSSDGDLRAISRGRDAGKAWPCARVGKKASGRLLDGREHNGFPDEGPPF